MWQNLKLPHFIQAREECDLLHILRELDVYIACQNLTVTASVLDNVLSGFEHCFQDLANTLLGMEASTSMRGVRTCR